MKSHTSIDHPLFKSVLEGMRMYAERDKYHGATWETIVTLCDEVDYLNEELEKCRAEIARLRENYMPKPQKEHHEENSVLFSRMSCSCRLRY